MWKLVLFAMALAVGQLLFKRAAEGLSGQTGMAMLQTLAFNPAFIAAVVLYAFSTILWVVILRDTPLSRAYPFVALGFVIVPMAAWAVFKEPLSLRYGLGAALILAGVWISAGAQSNVSP